MAIDPLAYEIVVTDPNGRERVAGRVLRYGARGWRYLSSKHGRARSRNYWPTAAEAVDARVRNGDRTLKGYRLRECAVV